MKFATTYKNVEVREPVELEANRQVGKMEKLLKSYAPDAVQLHACFEKQARKPEYNVSLNLSLPTGTLHCTGTGADIPRSLKTAFAELSSQIKKHQSRLRHDSEWKRKRPRASAVLA
jgi:ribosome-associated translation inhibitor RaiA